jgi:hypothetical protein
MHEREYMVDERWLTREGGGWLYSVDDYVRPAAGWHKDKSSSILMIARLSSDLPRAHRTTHLPPCVAPP